MGLFSKKKKQVEVINLDPYYYEKKDELFIKQDKIQKEETIVNHTVDDVFTLSRASKSKFEEILHEYYMCKIFSRVALSEAEFHQQESMCDTYVNNVKELLDKDESLLQNIENDGIDINAIFKTINETVNQEDLVKSRLNDVNANFLGVLKLTTSNVCILKNNHELKEFYDNVSDFLSNYSSLKDAANDIKLNSCAFIEDLIQTIIKVFEFSNNPEYINKYSYPFFGYKNEIMNSKEWIDLYNKIKFAYKVLNELEVEAKMLVKDKFEKFELIYTIFMMRNEIEQNLGR